MNNIVSFVLQVMHRYYVFFVSTTNFTTDTNTSILLDLYLLNTMKKFFLQMPVVPPILI